MKITADIVYPYATYIFSLLRRLLLSYTCVMSWLCYCVGVCIHWGYWCWSHCWVRPCRGFFDWGSGFPSTKITAAGTIRQNCSPCKVCILYFILGLKNNFLSRSSQKKGAISGKKKIPKSTFDMTKGTTQPSQKWKSLGLTDEKFYTAPQSPLKTASRFGDIV